MINNITESIVYPEQVFVFSRTVDVDYHWRPESKCSLILKKIKDNNFRDLIDGPFNSQNYKIPKCVLKVCEEGNVLLLICDLKIPNTQNKDWAGRNINISVLLHYNKINHQILNIFQKAIKNELGNIENISLLNWFKSHFDAGEKGLDYKTFPQDYNKIKFAESESFDINNDLDYCRSYDEDNVEMIIEKFLSNFDISKFPGLMIFSGDYVSQNFIDNNKPIIYLCNKIIPKNEIGALDGIKKIVINTIEKGINDIGNYLKKK